MAASPLSPFYFLQLAPRRASALELWDVCGATTRRRRVRPCAWLSPYPATVRIFSIRFPMKVNRGVFADRGAAKEVMHRAAVRPGARHASPPPNPQACSVLRRPVT